MAQQEERVFPTAEVMDERVASLLARLKVQRPTAGTVPDPLLLTLLRFQPLGELFRRAREARGWSQARAARAVGLARDDLDDLEGIVGLVEADLVWAVDLAWHLGIGEPLAQWIEANPTLAFASNLPDAPTVRGHLVQLAIDTRQQRQVLPPIYAPPAEWRELATGPLEQVPALLGDGQPLGWRLLVVVRGVEPTIWRRLEVRLDLTLAQLHEILQVAFDWNGSHLHAWEVGGKRLGRPDLLDEMDVEDDRKVLLQDLPLEIGQAMEYVYDFGDGWRVRVQLEAVLATADRPAARCLNGRRASPPDDAGGPPGYAELLGVLAGPPTARRRELRQWVGADFEPENFDADDINAALARRNRRWQRKVR